MRACPPSTDTKSLPHSRGQTFEVCGGVVSDHAGSVHTKFSMERVPNSLNSDSTPPQTTSMHKTPNIQGSTISAFPGNPRFTLETSSNSGQKSGFRILFPDISGAEIHGRPVIHLRSLNRHTNAPSFVMHTTSSVLDTVKPGDWAFTVDLKDAYLHVPIHPRSQHLLRFAWSSQEVYQFRALPFGLNTAPYIFTKLVKIVGTHLHRLGITVVPYLDDWLFLHQDRNVLLEQQTIVLQLLKQLGFLLNVEKSMLVPSQDIKFLGMRLLLLHGMACLPQDRVEQTQTLVRSYMSKTSLSYSESASLLGHQIGHQQ